MRQINMNYKPERIYSAFLFSLIFLILIGCVSHHVPKPEIVDFSGIQKVDNKISMNIINVQDNTEEKNFGNYGAGKMVGDLKKWTDSAVEMAKNSLEEKGVSFNDESSKIVKFAIVDVKVDTAGIPFVASLARCKIILNVETGNGYTQTYEATNDDLNPPWASNKAMKKVVGAFLNDKNILDYINAL